MSFENQKIEEEMKEDQQKFFVKEKSIESPRIIVRLMEDGDDDQGNSMNQLLEYMACFSSKESSSLGKGVSNDLLERNFSSRSFERDK